MQPDQIHLSDWYRILLGQAPALFLVEVVIRAVITYIILLVTMRMMGKRVAGQMSAIEMTIVVTLGAAIGVPLQAPDRGMIPAAVILLVAVLYQRGLNLWAFCSRRAEVTIQGDVVTLVKDGHMELGTMRQSVLSRERLYSVLRQAGIVHLGQVKRVYLEADGHFSIYKNDNPTVGLCIMPAVDYEQFERQFRVKNAFACRSCGESVMDHDTPPGPCPRCDERQWSPAVQSVDVSCLEHVPS